MKAKLHPKWYPEADISCACGASWKAGAAVPKLRLDICSACHPFFTGEQRIVDTEGQVDRFMRRLRAREAALAEKAQRLAARTSPTRELTTLDLGKRVEKLLTTASFKTVGDVLSVLTEKGDDGLTDIKGFGVKALVDLKKGLRVHGYVLPGDEPPAA